MSNNWYVYRLSSKRNNININIIIMERYDIMICMTWIDMYNLTMTQYLKKILL